MKYINSLEATIKAYSDSEIDEMYDRLSDVTYEAYNIIDDEVYDNPIHRTLAKYWDMVSRERVRRGLHEK